MAFNLILMEDKHLIAPIYSTFGLNHSFQGSEKEPKWHKTREKVHCMSQDPLFDTKSRNNVMSDHFIALRGTSDVHLANYGVREPLQRFTNGGKGVVKPKS